MSGHVSYKRLECLFFPLSFHRKCCPHPRYDDEYDDDEDDDDDGHVTACHSNVFPVNNGSGEGRAALTERGAVPVK